MMRYGLLCVAACLAMTAAIFCGEPSARIDLFGDSAPTLKTGPGFADEIDLFGAPEGSVRQWRSSQPSLLPLERPAAPTFDLFAATPPPTAADFQRLADKRFDASMDRPVVVGMTADGAIANYDEAYRIAKRDGKKLVVCVGDVRCGLDDPQAVYVRVAERTDNRFTAPGVYEFQLRNGVFWENTGPRTARYSPEANAVKSCANPECTCPDCKCDPCQCVAKPPAKPGYRWQCDERGCKQVPIEAQPSAAYTPPPALQYVQPPVGTFAPSTLNYQPAPVHFYAPSYQPATSWGSFGFSGLGGGCASCGS